MFKEGATCRGSYALGTACGKCEKCKEELERSEPLTMSMCANKQDFVEKAMKKIRELEGEANGLLIRADGLKAQVLAIRGWKRHESAADEFIQIAWYEKDDMSEPDPDDALFIEGLLR